MNPALKFEVPVFSDSVLNSEVKDKQPLLYDKIVYNRKTRFSNAFKDWMKDFPNEPLPFKKSLELQIQSIEATTNPHYKILEKLNILKNQLQSGEYCEEANAHALYRGAYEDRKLAFVWPTTEESALRLQEESELLAQINK